MTDKNISTATTLILIPSLEKQAKGITIRLILLLVLALPFLCLIIILMWWGNFIQHPVLKDYVSLVRISEEIGTGTRSSIMTLRSLEKAFTDSKSKGVMILINSLGGTPIQESAIDKLIITLKTKCKKDDRSWGRYDGWWCLYDCCSR
ncbi:hypothetical protein MNBD_GAMMA12-3657 [hydrothermal vent metagenome]|uniref:Periplasmic serine proteases (ClpP class) n=1 Tax=hydrothermal vent metagenome TaxID=652676 RepID=A0A3B0Y489_9ZZZZ